MVWRWHKTLAPGSMTIGLRRSLSTIASSRPPTAGDAYGHAELLANRHQRDPPAPLQFGVTVRDPATSRRRGCIHPGWSRPAPSVDSIDRQVLRRRDLSGKASQADQEPEPKKE